MTMTSPSFTRLRRRLRLAAAVPAFLGFALLSEPSAHAKPVPSNLGNGLDKLVESNLAVAAAQRKGVALSGAVTVNGKTYTDEQTAGYPAHALSDATSGRVMVRINTDGTVR